MSNDDIIDQGDNRPDADPKLKYAARRLEEKDNKPVAPPPPKVPLPPTTTRRPDEEGTGSESQQTIPLFSPIDNPGTGPASPPSPPPAVGGGAGGGGQPDETPSTPPTTLPSPTELRLYMYDEARGALIPFKPDYSLSIPYMPTAASGRKLATPRVDKKLGVIVPLIKIAPNSADWMQLVSIAQRHPYPDVIAIVNPSLDNRGIGATGGPSAEFTNAINYLVNTGIRVVGYINTDQHAKTISTVMTEIIKWFDWYPNISGVFFDDDSSDKSAAATGTAMEDYYRQLDRFTKEKHREKQGQHGIQQQVSDAITILNLASGKQPGAATNLVSFQPLFSDTGIDIFTIYEQEGYPADANYVELKRDWIARYPRSKFAMIAYHAPETDIAIRNFVDKATEIEKMAGYVYATTEWITNMRDATALSPLIGTIMDQMDVLARQARIPTSSRGGASLSVRPDTGSGPQVSQATAMAEEEQAIATRAGDVTKYDPLGVRMIYPTFKKLLPSDEDPFEWYIGRANRDLTKDPNLRNLPKGLRTLDNGAYETMKRDADQVRIECWNPKNRKKMLNVEISGYFRVIQAGGRYLIQEYARGGHHYRDQGKWCEGSAYKGRLMSNGAVCAVKEVHHQGYTNNRGITQATNKPMLQRWFGFKTIIYNYSIPESPTTNQVNVGRLGVAIELWIDDNSDDGQGNLVVKNDWRHIATIRDQGGWFASKDDFLENKCKPLSIDNKGRYRKRDEIINMPGGLAEQNCVAWRWDDATVQFSHLSVREIQRISPD